MKDYLIVGQGVAGSFLAWELIGRGKSVVIVDDEHKQSSSMVAAGIINPITGKRFALRDQFDMFFNFARSRYHQLEEFFDCPFFETKPILRIFQNQEEREHWDRKNDLGLTSQYLQHVYQPRFFKGTFKDPFGSIMISRSGFCWTTQLLAAFKNYFLKEEILSQQRISYDEIKADNAWITYRNEKFKSVIFCEGFQAQFNPWFNWIPFNSVKGEILKIKMKSASLPDVIINKGKWCAPQGNDTWAAGASYIWDELNCLPTEEGKREIRKALNSNINRHINIINHQAAVRPVINDQYAVLGAHPNSRNIFIFNGLGSKGFLTAPLYAYMLADHLTEMVPLPSNVSTKRFNLSAVKK